MSISSENAKVCISCGHFIEKSSNFCNSCGSTQETFKKCNSCSKTLPKDSDFCSSCGTSTNKSGNLDKFVTGTKSNPEKYNKSVHKYGPFGIGMWIFYSIISFAVIGDPANKGQEVELLFSYIVTAIFIHFVIVGFKSLIRNA